MLQIKQFITYHLCCGKDQKMLSLKLNTQLGYQSSQHLAFPRAYRFAISQIMSTHLQTNPFPVTYQTNFYHVF